MATHKAGKPSAGRHLQACSEWSCSSDLINRDGFFNAFYLGLAQRGEGEVAVRELIRLFRHEYRARIGELFHTGRDVSGMPDRNIVGMQVVFANRADYHLACVHPDSHL